MTLLFCFFVGGIGGYVVNALLSSGPQYSAYQVRKIIDELYAEIAHGDKAHRVWLWDKMQTFMERKRIR